MSGVYVCAWVGFSCSSIPLSYLVRRRFLGVFFFFFFFFSVTETHCARFELNRVFCVNTLHDDFYMVKSVCSPKGELK